MPKKKLACEHFALIIFTYYQNQYYRSIFTLTLSSPKKKYLHGQVFSSYFPRLGGKKSRYSTCIEIPSHRLARNQGGESCFYFQSWIGSLRGGFDQDDNDSLIGSTLGTPRDCKSQNSSFSVPDRLLTPTASSRAKRFGKPDGQVGYSSTHKSRLTKFVQHSAESFNVSSSMFLYVTSVCRLPPRRA